MFIDNSGNGIADSDGLKATNWVDGTGDPVPYSYSIVGTAQAIRINPGGTGTGDANPVMQFTASPGDTYVASATVSFQNVTIPANFWARLTIWPRNGTSPIANSECNAVVAASKDVQGADVADQLVVLKQGMQTKMCEMPSGTTNFLFKIRAHRNSAAASGTVLFHEVSLKRT